VGNGTWDTKSPEQGEEGKCCSEIPIILVLNQGCRELPKYRMKGWHLHGKNIET